MNEQKVLWPAVRLDPLIDAYTAVLEVEPLDNTERERGVALRVPLATRVGDADIKQPPSAFFWSVLTFERLRTAKPGRIHAPSLSAMTLLRVLKRRAHTKMSLLAKTVMHFQDADWLVCEYALIIPFDMSYFEITWKGITKPIDISHRNKAIDAYFARIRNAAAADDQYGAWLACHKERLSRDVPVPEGSDGPLMSIVCPIYQTPPAYLRQMIDSVIAQTYERWELVLVNASPQDEGVRSVLAEYTDDRIKVVNCADNLGIAGNTNTGLEHCSGDYVSFLDHDDFVEPQALAAYVGAIQSSSEPVDIMYCDEDSIDAYGQFWNPLFKPVFNQDLLYSNNYIIHWLTVSRFALEHVQRSSERYEGAQDYDLTFKAIALGRGVVHVPYVLYHWRIHPGSENMNPGAKDYAQENGRVAIADQLDRDGLPASVVRGPTPFTYRAIFGPHPGKPSLSLLCVGGEPTSAMRSAACSYGNTVGKPTCIEMLDTDDTHGLHEALKACTADLLLVVAAGIELTPDDLEILAGYFVRDRVFATSPRVVRQDGLMEYAGAIVRPDGTIAKMGRLLPLSDEGYIGRLHRPYSAAVLNPACCMYRMSALANNGLDENFQAYTQACNDACLRAFEGGLENVYTPFATASIVATRSIIADEDQVTATDAALLVSKHPSIANGDPSHNKNFDPWSPYYLLNMDS